MVDMKFWIGTSGFQYAEWKGNFYPEDLPAAKMLPFYADRFSTTEINYTFHRIPAPKTIDNWKAQTPTRSLRQRRLPPITATSGSAAKIIKRPTSNVGQTSRANRNRIGKTRSSISSTKKAASGRNSRSRC